MTAQFPNNITRFFVALMVAVLYGTLLSNIPAFAYTSPFISEDSGNIPAESIHTLNSADDLDLLLNATESRRLVLLGEASHGTAEFYTWRADISRRLIEEKGFRFVAVEGDWPLFTRLNAWVKNKPGSPDSIEEAFEQLDRWPLWMWKNAEFRSFVAWLREHNSALPLQEKVGLYGVDLYAKRRSMQDVSAWLHTRHPYVAHRADEGFQCMLRYPNASAYVRAVAQSGEHCGEALTEVLNLIEGLPVTGSNQQDVEAVYLRNWEHFNAIQNMLAVINAEIHYRGNLVQGPHSWNARAGHFMLTAARLADFYEGLNETEPKGIVWAHNTHIGDARATDMNRFGMVNIGQLARENYGQDRVLAVGFGTWQGEVLAARSWEGPMETMLIAEARDDSWEMLLSRSSDDDAFYLFTGDTGVSEIASIPYPHRAIGVTFQPENERLGNYPVSVPAQRYDIFVFIRNTTALNPLD